MSRFAMLVVVFISGAILAQGAYAEGTPQTMCPVMGRPVHNDISVDYNGQRVYFCCEGCAGEFKKDPDKYLAKMAADGVVLEKAPVAQTLCPVTNKPVNREIFVDHMGKRIYFCCTHCVTEFKKDPDMYLATMASDGITLEDAPITQLTCPVSGHPINTASFTDYEGQRVYFCCDNCKAEFSKNPGKYMDKPDESATAPKAGSCANAPRSGCAGMGGCGAKG